MLVITNVVGGMMWLPTRYRYPGKPVYAEVSLSANGFKANTVLHRKKE